MKSFLDVVIVGAGPYGLSLSAHLKSSGLAIRHFGLPMQAWSGGMPEGMYLKSEAFVSSISDPHRAHSLGAYCRSTGTDYSHCGVPVSLDTFTAYGKWFQQRQAPDLEETLVRDIRMVHGGYELELADGEQLRSRNVVVATGVQHFIHFPRALRDLPPDLCSHSSTHGHLDRFRGRDVTVIGAGQSALEYATLLHEQGASVRLIARAAHIRWNDDPPSEVRSLLARVRNPTAGLGNGWSNWFFSTKPYLFRRLPATQRVHLAHTALGPAGAWWLRPRAEGRVSMLVGHRLVGAVPLGNKVQLRLRSDDGEQTELVTEHVIAATGFRPRVDRFPFLHQNLRAELQTLDGSPWVGPEFQSSHRGLFFTGPAVASCFGPVMRFVYGADFAARKISQQLSTSPRAPQGVPNRSQRVADGV